MAIKNKTVDNSSIEDLLNEADEKLKQAGIDPEGHPEDDEEGADGGLQPKEGEESEEEVVDEEKEKKDKKDADDDGSKKDDDAEEDDDDKGKKKDSAGSATDEDGNKVTFKNAQELSDFVAAQMKTIEDSKKTPEEKKEAQDKLESMTFFEEGYKPKDWNVAMREIIKHIRPVLKKMDKEEGDAVSEKVKAVNDEFDKIYDGLSKDHNLPKRGTAEGNEVDRQITSVGAAYGIGDYKKAHAIWSKLPKDTEITLPSGKTTKVGGLDYKPEAKADPAKKVNPSKQVAKLQSPGKSGGSPQSKKIEYKGIHENSMDKLLEEDL